MDSAAPARSDQELQGLGQQGCGVHLAEETAVAVVFGGFATWSTRPMTKAGRAAQSMVPGACTREKTRLSPPEEGPLEVCAASARACTREKTRLSSPEGDPV